MRILLLCFLNLMTSQLLAQNITIDINPGHTRAIHGHSELNRLKYFNLSDRGSWFESKANKMEGPNYFLADRKISFGRDLGLVFSEKNWGSSLREDANRSGFADITFMKNNLNPNELGASSAFKQHFAPNLDVVNHDRHNAFPNWMDKYTTSQSGDEWIPKNLEAATEITTNLLQYRYTDLHRPAYFELVNEPHWSYWKDQHFADWHKDLAISVREKGINTKIGGPCLSVAYLYRDNYQYLFNFTKFIDNTDFELDFYSFHIYDYYRWNESAHEFTGTISTGLPMLGVIDAVANYTRINYDKPAKLVISEHGGYVSQNETEVINRLGEQYFPGTGFENEMEKRSILNFIMVNSAITNTFTFMENPHLILKTVPFILFESAGWDPTYYSSMMTPWDFTDTDKWAESKLVHYFEFFQNAQGRRVRMHCPDPDLQHTAFLADNELNVLINNMANKAELLDFNLPETYQIESIELVSLNRQDDFRPEMTKETLTSLNNIHIGGRSALSLTIKFTESVQEEVYLNEIPFYSNEVAEKFQGQKTFKVAMDNLGKIEYAYMQIGINRPTNTEKTINVTLNGTALSVPLEDAADRFTSDNSYASTKIIPVDPILLRENNEVKVAFTDSRDGGVGSVVIRAAIQDLFVNVEERITQNDFSLFPNPSNNSFSIAIDAETLSKIESILIYNSNGQLIDELAVGTDSTAIHWSNKQESLTPAGVYHIILKDKNGYMTSRKWVKL